MRIIEDVVAAEQGVSEEAVLEVGLQKKGKLQESLAAFNKLTTLGMQAEGFYGSGLVKFKSGDMDEAIAHLTRSLNVDRKNANAYYYLGVIAEKRQQPSVANSYYKKALEINPRHAGALKKLEVPGGATQTPLVPPSPPPDVSAMGVMNFIRRDPSPL